MADNLSKGDAGCSKRSPPVVLQCAVVVHGVPVWVSRAQVVLYCGCWCKCLCAVQVVCRKLLPCEAIHSANFAIHGLSLQQTSLLREEADVEVQGEKTEWRSTHAVQRAALFFPEKWPPLHAKSSDGARAV